MADTYEYFQPITLSQLIKITSGKMQRLAAFSVEFGGNRGSVFLGKVGYDGVRVKVGRKIQIVLIPSTS